MDDALKQWIDEASYADLLWRWRTAPVGDPMFQGEIGRYYDETMKRRRNEVGQAEHVRASKQIGWGEV